MSTTVQALATYEDYAALPDDGLRRELLDGRLSVVPAPLTLHQRGAHRLAVLLDLHVVQRRLGEVLEAPVDVILGKHDTVQPDLLFVSREHADRISVRGIEGAPDLVVEILSEGTAVRDCIEKRAIYQRAGVPEYWIVDPKMLTLSVLVLDAGAFCLFSKAEAGEVVRSRVFPDLEFTPGSLFEPPRFED